MAYKDLREYIDILDANGELLRVQAQVDWNLEIGAITRHAMDLRAPAPLFENIKDCPKGFRILGLPVGPSKPNLHGRMALALGLNKDTKAKQMIGIFRNRLNNPIKPKVISDAPCKENIMKGDDVDVLKFPSPLVHSTDGSRYLGTWHLCITKSQAEGWVNWAIYRIAVHNKNTLGLNLHEKMQHGGKMYYTEYDKNDKPMPIALAIGTEPVTTISGATSFPYGADQPSLTGGLREASVEMVKCETVDLEVPASSEIVIEGEVPPGLTMEEGPFGEFTGHTGSGRYPKPVIKIKCVTYRNNPILPVTNMGKPWDDDSVCESITRSAMTVKILQDSDLPVRSAFCYHGYLMVISSESRPRLVQRVVEALNNAKCRSLSYWTIIVNEDVDPTDSTDVMWSLATRTNPGTGIHVERRPFVNELYPLLTPEERKNRNSSRAYLDSTFPPDWPEEYKKEHCQVIDFERAWPKELQKEVLKKWKEYGFSSE